MPIDSRKTSNDLDHFLEDWCSGNNQDWRRAAFLERLEGYVPKRPRTYADRKWLEGYVETAQTLRPVESRGGFIAGEKGYLDVVDRICETLAKMQHKPLTSRGEGQIDAWLDAVGC